MQKIFSYENTFQSITPSHQLWGASQLVVTQVGLADMIFFLSRLECSNSLAHKGLGLTSAVCLTVVIYSVVDQIAWCLEISANADHENCTCSTQEFSSATIILTKMYFAVLTFALVSLSMQCPSCVRGLACITISRGCSRTVISFLVRQFANKLFVTAPWTNSLQIVTHLVTVWIGRHWQDNQQRQESYVGCTPSSSAGATPVTKCFAAGFDLK